MPSCRRIISIAPDATEIIASLGEAGRLVAVSTFCLYPPEIKSLPRVGGLFDADLEAILQLRPDLIVLRGRHKAIERICAENGIELFHDRTENFADIFATVRDLGGRLGRRDRAEEVVRSMQARLSRIESALAKRPRPRVLVTLSRRPDSMAQIMTAGQGTFIDEMIHLAGGENLFGDLAVAYPHISPEGILAKRPEVILELMPETKSTAALETSVRRLWRDLGPTPASDSNRIFIITDENCEIPSPRIVDIVAKIARLLHPEAGLD